MTTMPAPDRTAYRRGLLFLLLSALGFSTSLVLANKALLAGASPLTINLARFIIASVLVFGFLKLTRRDVHAPGSVVPAIVLGCLVLSLSLSYVSSTQYIPVSLAVLVFYTNPFMVALVARALDKTPLTPVRLLAMVVAFAGLGMALEIWNAFALDWRGVSLATLTALSLTGIYIVSGRAMRAIAPQTLSFQAFLAAAVIVALITVLTGGPVWPQANTGWVWLALTGVFYALGQGFIFSGIALAGPVPSSLIMNLEPVFTIALAVLLLGDRLGPVQALGAGLVIAAVYAVSRTGKAKPPAT